MAPTATTDSLDLTFKALADPTRRSILARLAEGEASVLDLAAPFEMSQPAISKHLRVLERAGLVITSIDGRTRPRRINPEPLVKARVCIETFRETWEENFRRLDELLDELQSTGTGDER